LALDVDESDEHAMVACSLAGFHLPELTSRVTVRWRLLYF
jgi:hypothetical protein